MIPKIIHQIWEGKTEPVPEFLSQLSETWKNHHPHWQYEFWDFVRMEKFVEEYFPEFSETYYSYRYPVQRWDAIRYLILYKIGGLYVDFDYDCLEPFDAYLAENGKCYFPIEPESHSRAFGEGLFFNNALMLSPPGHSFFERIISHLKTTPTKYTQSKFRDVLSSTGPLMLSALYEKYEDKSSVGFLEHELVSPWTKGDVQDYIAGKADEALLDKKLEKAIAIHYFWGTWI